MMTRRGLFKTLGGLLGGVLVGTRFQWARTSPKLPVISPEMAKAMGTASRDLFNPPRAVLESFYRPDPLAAIIRDRDYLLSMQHEMIALQAKPPFVVVEKTLNDFTISDKYFLDPEPSVDERLIKEMVQRLNAEIERELWTPFALNRPYDPRYVGGGRPPVREVSNGAAPLNMLVD